MPVLRVYATEPVFERIDAIKIEFAFADQFHALHDLYEPSPRFNAFVTQKERHSPLMENLAFVLRLTFSNKEYLARFGNLIQEDVAADPPGSPCSRGQWLPFLDDLTHKEVLRHDEQVRDAELLEIVVQQK